jgi:MFS family permease
VLLGLIILTSVVDSVTIGYDGSIMGYLLVMDTFSGYFNLDTATTSLSVCFIFVGGAIGALFAPFVANKRGRKEGMLYAAVLQIIGVILQTAAQNISMFIVGRFIIGLGTGIANVAAPVYVAETAPAKFRALALGLCYTYLAVGTLLASGICYGASITCPQYITLLITEIDRVYGNHMGMENPDFDPSSPIHLLYSHPIRHS